jgi:3-hydroxybutyryl-CoA dehydratase
MSEIQLFHKPHEVVVGMDLGGREYEVTADLVDRYARGTAEDNDLYRRPGIFGRPPAPALLFHSEVYRDLSWYLPNLVGNLHAAQEWEIFRPFLVGDRVRTHSTVVERYVRRNREYVVNEVLLTDANGAWLQRSRTHQSFLIQDGTAGYVVDKDREKRPDRKQELPQGGGDELEPAARTITIEMCQAFSGPHRNYHTDREMAQALGFPDVVVQGMMSVCFLSEMMTRNFGAGWFYGGRLNVKLVNVVWPDDALRIRGRIREEVPEGGRTRVHADVWCEKGDDVKTVVGTASALR